MGSQKLLDFSNITFKGDICNTLSSSGKIFIGAAAIEYQVTTGRKQGFSKKMNLPVSLVTGNPIHYM
jgi:hypothetical protein